MMATDLQTLEEKLYTILTTSTGRHMLDSGGAYGRHWEHNQLRTLESFKEEEATLDEYGDLTIPLFHHLVEALHVTRLSEALDEEFKEFIKDREGSYLEDIEAFIENIGADEGYSENSYNRESNLSQVIQYQTFTLGGTEYVALQIHQGADVRGGYTRPYIFELADEYALRSEYASILCTGEEKHRYDWSNEWLIEGSCAPSPYELMTEARKVGITDYIPCYQCGAPLEGTDTRKEVNA
jgi:predicted house-cleaning noncanonical NTP pyrophosphatase (MazG superfamily)